jgi:hypothetical protein
MKIELLYFSGCPTFKNAETVLSEVMAELDIDTPVEKIDVQSQEEAVERKFLGSPTIKVDGLDVDKSAREATDYALKCRVYQKAKGF